jgi:hypothetical protein
VWIRLYDAEGASVTQPFLIGALNELEEIEPNDKPRLAQTIAEPNVTVNGVLKDAEVDCFAVPLAAGQTLVATLDANTRLGSPMDSILQIVTQEGIVLAENHDDLNLDPRLSFTASKAGTYVVRIFAFPATPNTTIRFNGGSGHIYRLTLTTGPYVTHAVPLAAPLSNPGDVSLAGWNIPPDARLRVVPFGLARLIDFQEFEPIDELRRSQDARIGYAFAPGFPSATRVRLTPYTVLTRLLSDDSNNPTILPVSSTMTGCLKSRRQTDDYLIPLTKGQQVVISVEARSLDVPLDPIMKLTDPAGAIIADVDDTGPSRDSAIAHTAAHDGNYRLSVSDRFRQGGERCWYLLTVRLEQSDFELSATADTVLIPTDKPGELSVKIQRRGTSAETVGPITVQAVGLPESVTSPVVVSETMGPTATEVKLTFTSPGLAFSGPIRIIGKSIQPKEIERFARTPARLGVSFETIWLTVAEKPK